MLGFFFKIFVENFLLFFIMPSALYICNGLMKLFKDWNIFEKILLFWSVLVIIVVGIFFKSDLLTVSCSVMWALTALLIAKGNNLCRLFGILADTLYSIVSFNNQFYWEVFVHVIFLVMDILWVISWIHHKNKETNFVKINLIKRKEWILAFVAFFFLFVWIYYLLKFFDTNELVISTVSVVLTLYAMYFLVRRSKYSLVIYLFCDVTLILLWWIYVFKGNAGLVPVLINSIILFVNDSYGFYNWIKVEKLQRVSDN